MFKIVHASVRNFGSCVDVDLNFETCDGKPVTIIRAENGSGKTTLIRALRWGMFGDNGLMQGTERENYRISPNHLVPASEGKSNDVEIEVEIQFLKTSEVFGTTKKFILVRKTKERLEYGGNFQVLNNELDLFQEHSEEGMIPLRNPRVKIASELLRDSMKDIFFTDNEELNSFLDIENRNLKVQDTVETLLGINQVRSIDERLTKITNSIRSELSRNSTDQKSKNLEIEIAKIENSLKDISSKKEEIARQLKGAQNMLDDLDAKKQSCLIKGAGEAPALKKELDEIKRKKRASLENKSSSEEKLCNFIASDLFGSYLSDAALTNVWEIFEPMVNEGRLPNFESDLLRRVLDSGECICGQPAVEGSDIFNHLTAIIEKRKVNDLRDKRLSELRTDLIRISAKSENSAGLKEYKRLKAEIAKSNKNLFSLSSREKEIEASLENIEDTGLSEILESIKTYQQLKDKKVGELAVLNQAEKREDNSLKLKNEEWSQVARKNKAVSRILRKKQHAESLHRVVKECLNFLTTNTIDEVSQLMQNTFENMVKASEYKKYNRIYIGGDYDLKILNDNGVVINPSTLSGAERRAFILSFILSLVKKSGESAPLFVDTPLAMTSGAVRLGILQYMISLSEQVILFITPAEVVGVEEILREKTSNYITLTNAAHYPTQIANYLGYDYDRTVTCTCSPFVEPCPVCERVEVEK